MPETPASWVRLLGEHRRIAIDSNVLIYLLEGEGPRADLAADLVDAIAHGTIEGVLASVAIAEILIPAAVADDPIGFERTAATLRDLGLRIVALDTSVAEDAAWIRGRTGATLPDAVHLASARSAGATVFVTNDARMPGLPALPVAIVDDLIA